MNRVAGVAGRFWAIEEPVHVSEVWHAWFLRAAPFGRVIRFARPFVVGGTYGKTDPLSLPEPALGPVEP